MKFNHRTAQKSLPAHFPLCFVTLVFPPIWQLSARLFLRWRMCVTLLRNPTTAETKKRIYIARTIIWHREYCESNKSSPRHTCLCLLLAVSERRPRTMSRWQQRAFRTALWDITLWIHKKKFAIAELHYRSAGKVEKFSFSSTTQLRLTSLCLLHRHSQTFLTLS